MKVVKYSLICKTIALLFCLPVSAYGQTAAETRSTSCDPELERKNKTLIQAFINEGQTGRNLDAVSKYLSSDFTDHSAPLNPNFDSAKSASLAFHEALFAAFPDFHVKIHLQVAECDKVVTYKTFHGTHKNEFFGFPATNVKMEINVIDILRIEEGQVADHWVVNNLVEQLMVKSKAKN